jgi:CreA protein
MQLLSRLRLRQAGSALVIAGMSVFTASFATDALSQEVGQVGVDWLGNDIVVEAVQDPDVQGVTCHIAFFDRGVIDRLQKGNWFEDPSNNAIECRQTGPVVIGDIERGPGGEEIFNNRRSLVWKKLVVNRIFDEQNNTLVYLAHTREVQDGSAKMSISTVPLYQVSGAEKAALPQMR